MRVLAWPAFRKEAANPHAALLARTLIRLGVDVADWTPRRALVRPGGIWHLHHPETVLYRRGRAAAACETVAFLALMALARLRGTRMLWTIHDLGSNDRLHPRLEGLFWRVFVARLDAVVCLSEESRRAAQARFPVIRSMPSHVLPHGHYRDAYPNTTTRKAARRTLGLTDAAPVILHFGLIRPYKNAPHLIRVFREAAMTEAVLLVAGKPFDTAVEREVREAAAGGSGVRLDLRWIAPEEVQHFFAASDLVALPYRQITNSGAALLALTFGRPVLVPDKGSMREHQASFGAQWVRLYRGEMTSDELTAALDWARAGDRPPLDLGALDWAAVAKATRAIYEGLARADRSAAAAGDRGHADERAP